METCDRGRKKVGRNMIDLADTITKGQIAFSLAVIALALVYIAFGKKPSRSRK